MPRKSNREPPGASDAIGKAKSLLQSVRRGGFSRMYDTSWLDNGTIAEVVNWGIGVALLWALWYVGTGGGL